MRPAPFKDECGREMAAWPRGHVLTSEGDTMVRLRLLAAGTTLAVMGGLIAGLSAQAPTGEVVSSSGVISPIIGNYERTQAFYGGLLGLQAPAPRTISAKDTPFPVLLNLQGLPEAKMTWGHVTIPGTVWWGEPFEYGDVDRKPV